VYSSHAFSDAWRRLRPTGRHHADSLRKALEQRRMGNDIGSDGHNHNLNLAIEAAGFSCDEPLSILFKMTKAELQSAIAEATQTDKRTAGVFLDTLGAIAYKATKKSGEFVVPGFGKLVKQKRKARTGLNPKTQQKIKISAKTVLKFRVFKVAKDAILGAKK
jgi:DNA-binding protein HU-beta